MNRNKLKTYAPQARRDFIKAITDRAAYYGLTADQIEPITEQGDTAIIGGKPFPGGVAAKRKKLEERIRREGFHQVIEAMAYTWFNRLVAIRYMELHEYLDHGYRVLSHPDGDATPEIVQHAQHVDLPGLDQEHVVELKLDGTKESELYRLLLIAQCNALHHAMPFLFEKINDETELLLPENLLHSDSLLRKLVNEIPEEDWQEVEIIGWLYQFYISEKKEEVIGKVVKSEDIPAATQLFTPNWIVKYLVQNSLGRQWVATYPDSSLKAKMEYYIEPAEQTPEVEAQLREITPESLNLEELTLLDPACGSGHILVEAYELLKAIYQERGYRAKDIPRLILEKNLYGLEIDDRAAQLAAFALMMKARADDRRIFASGVQPMVLSIQESQGMDAEEIFHALANEDEEEIGFTQADIAALIDLFQHGKTFGSLIQVPDALPEKLPLIAQRVEQVVKHGSLLDQIAKTLETLIQQARVLARRYDAVVANPPYMGSRFQPRLLKELIQREYTDTKRDIFASFISRGLSFAQPRGSNAMITRHSWMFLSSYEEFRSTVLATKTLLTMAHLGAGAFPEISGEVVQATAFVLQNSRVEEWTPTFFRLVAGSESEKETALLRRHHLFDSVSQDKLLTIPGQPIAYSVSDEVRDVFNKGIPFGKVTDARQGLATGDNDRFTRLWHEVSSKNLGLNMVTGSDAKLSGKTWFPYNKGGDFRKWYGNLEFVLNWKNDGHDLKDFRPRSVIRNEQYYFRPGITWSDISTGTLGCRYLPVGCVPGHVAHNAYCTSEAELYESLAVMNSPVIDRLSKLLSPTLHFDIGYFKKLPYIKCKSNLVDLAKEAVSISLYDWNLSELSWDFSRHPLIGFRSLDEAFVEWRNASRAAIARLGSLEEEINDACIHAYGLQDELSSEVPEDQITLYRPERDDDIQRLVSYAIGCMMGRYSLDEPGLIYAHSGNIDFEEIYFRGEGRGARADREKADDGQQLQRSSPQTSERILLNLSKNSKPSVFSGI